MAAILTSLSNKSYLGSVESRKNLLLNFQQYSFRYSCRNLLSTIFMDGSNSVPAFSYYYMHPRKYIANDLVGVFLYVSLMSLEVMLKIHM